MQSTLWIDKYIELLFPTKNTDMKIQEGQQLKYSKIPTSLFKYTGYNECSFKNFENDNIWMASPRN